MSKEIADPLTPLQHLAAFLNGLGFEEDPECSETAQRVATFLEGWRPQAFTHSLDACEHKSYNPVVLRDLRFYSLCAHHLLPFFGQVDILHKPEGRIAGLGAFPKLLRQLAQRPQIQERLTEQLAEAIHASLGGQVGVRIRARHMCMEMRGSENGALVETWAMRGVESEEGGAGERDARFLRELLR